MAVALERPDLVSEAEFLALPESNQKIELVDGEVVVAPSPTLGHQLFGDALTGALRAWARDNPPARAASAPLDIRLGPERIVQPDVMVWPAGLASTDMPITTVPRLVVEILSRDRLYDRVTKRALYAEAGVQEYWIVDTALRQVEVARGPGLRTVAIEKGTLTTPLLDGFALDLPPVFDESGI